MYKKLPFWSRLSRQSLKTDGNNALIIPCHYVHFTSRPLHPLALPVHVLKAFLKYNRPFSSKGYSTHLISIHKVHDILEIFSSKTYMVSFRKRVVMPGFRYLFDPLHNPEPPSWFFSFCKLCCKLTLPYSAGSFKDTQILVYLCPTPKVLLPEFRMSMRWVMRNEILMTKEICDWRV